jgi:lysophospholipase L1-like esterase
MILKFDELNNAVGAIPCMVNGSWQLLYPGPGLSALTVSGSTPNSLAWSTQVGYGVGLAVPSTIYAVVGHECNVYFDNILRTYLRGNFVAEAINMYEFTVTCANGAQQNERWTYTPTSGQVGSIPWSITVAFNGVVLATASATVVTSAATAGASVSRKLLAIGESTSDVGSTWLVEVLNLCNYNCTSPTSGGGADNLTITLVGTNSYSAPDAGGTYRTVNCEGRTGRTTDWFLSSGSPFWYNTAFNFGHYLTANSITMAAGDWVFLVLGINDIITACNGTTYDIPNTSRAMQTIANYNTMIASIQKAVSGIRIALCLTIPPSAYQDSFPTYFINNGMTQARYRRNLDLLVENLIPAFDGQQSNNIYLCPIELGIDTVHNMSISTVSYPNVRSVLSCTRGTHPVHPYLPGYYQIADTVYAFLRAHES